MLGARRKMIDAGPYTTYFTKAAARRADAHHGFNKQKGIDLMNGNIVRGAAFALALLAAQTGLAANGDSLEGIGAVSEALGGTGVAAPQDGLTAMVNNPAGLGFAPGTTNGELTLGVSLFQPAVKTRIGTLAGTLSGGSDDPLFVIPFLGYSQPLDDTWSWGIAVYGTAGLGLDYRGKDWDLDGNPANGYEGDLFTRYSSLKLAPAFSYKPVRDLSVGAALQGDYSTLDLGEGKIGATSAGLELGALYRTGPVQLGAAYTTPQKFTYKDVYNFDAFTGDTRKDSLVLEQPAVYAGGIAWQPVRTLLVEFDAKYLTWGDSEGYSDLDWKNQWVFGIGTQYEATDKLALRAGFNYAKNPVAEHDGWDPQGITTVQGKLMPTVAYELFRNVGFPAIMQSHLTVGFSYRLTDWLTLNAAYAHVFEQSITSSSLGHAVNFESTLSADSLGLGFALAFR